MVRLLFQGSLKPWLVTSEGQRCPLCSPHGLSASCVTRVHPEKIVWGGWTLISEGKQVKVNNLHRACLKIGFAPLDIGAKSPAHFHEAACSPHAPGTLSYPSMIEPSFQKIHKTLIFLLKAFIFIITIKTIWRQVGFGGTCTPTHCANHVHSLFPVFFCLSAPVCHFSCRLKALSI